MRTLLTAVVCIAAITVGCDTNRPDFRQARWGDLRETVAEHERFMKRAEDGYDNGFGWAYIPPNEAVVLVYQTSLDNVLNLNGSANTEKELLNDLFGASQPTPDVLIGYVFDDQGHLCLGYICSRRIRAIPSNTLARRIMRHALDMHGNPDQISEDTSSSWHDNIRYDTTNITAIWETDRSKIRLHMDRWQDENARSFFWEFTRK